MTPDRTKAARELLAFYAEAGVDGVLREQPTNHFGPEESPANSATDAAQQRSTPALALTGSRLRQPEPTTAGTAAPNAPGASLPLSPDTAVMAAREAARNAASLDELRAIMTGFQGCALRVTATQLVFADGNPQARVMFVGEAPGRDEDLAGLPFVGRSGKLLDRMLAAIGLDRTSAYIANIIPWRPPGNRTPTPQESQICLPFILRQIELADPDVLVCLGGPSSQALLGFKDGIRRTRGRWLSFDTGKREIRAMATFHPAYLLRSPLEKRHAWRDFLAVKKALVPPI
ncbi:MAG: uracil-DNA glycosylase [Xanthobacteraceae bacterium]|jgi:uracil-DNA glycosylase